MSKNYLVGHLKHKLNCWGEEHASILEEHTQQVLADMASVDLGTTITVGNITGMGLSIGRKTGRHPGHILPKKDAESAEVASLRADLAFVANCFVTLLNSSPNLLSRIPLPDKNRLAELCQKGV